MDLTACARKALHGHARAFRGLLTAPPPRKQPAGGKIWKIMRLTTIFLLATAIHVSAAGHAQKITLKEKNVSLEKVFWNIHQQTGLQFAYKTELLSQMPKVNVEVRDATLEEVLRICFADLPLDYAIDNNVVLIKSRVVQAKPEPLPPPVIDIVIKVTDPQGNALVGASVKINGTALGGSSNGEGMVVIHGVDERAVLEVSYVGFEKLSVGVNGRKNIVLQLKRSENKLDDVQVIAYGTTSRRLSTGNTTTVKGEEIEKQPVGNALIAIQGRVPGLLIEQGSGAPGASMKIRIQGTNSLRAGGEPFYVVDGVPYASSLLYTVTNNQIWGDQNMSLAREGNGSPLSYLNPSDIESIEILKDADATAIYGSKAANGAILITTKKGRVGAVSVDVGLTQGWEDMPKRLKLLNRDQYLEMRHEAIRNSNAVIESSDYDLNGVWDTTRNTDWQEVFLGNASSYLNARLQVSGGNTGANYLLGVTYNQQKGMLTGDFSDRKISAHFSFNSASANQRFKMQFSGNYLVDMNRLPSVNLTSTMLYLPPVAPALRNPDGSLNWALNRPGGFSTWPDNGFNPLANLLNKFNTDVNNLVSNLMIGYTLLPGLEIKASLGYTHMQSDQLNTYPLSAIPPYRRPTSLRRSTFVFNTMKSYVAEPQLIYRKLIGKGNFDALLGGTIQKNINSGRGVNASGQVSDAQLENLSAAATVTSLMDLYSAYRYSALFTRLSYNYSNKYLLNATLRRDGSSRFGPESRFHSFAAVGAAWVLSEESFLHLPRAISFFKTKASYGIIGNDQIGDYTYMNLYAPVNVDVPYGGSNSLAVEGLFNPYLQWEETRKLNMGIDAGFLNDRLILGVNYAINRSTNLLQTFDLPTSAGYPSILRNFNGTVQNTSLEVILSSVIIKTKSFQWSAGVNFARGRNKLVKLPEADEISNFTYYGYVLGQPLGSFYAYRYRGIDPQTGQYVVENAKGDLTSTPDYTTDQTVLLNLQKPYYGGFNNNISYKGLQLDVFVQFVKQRAQRYYQAAGYRPGQPFLNQPISVLNRWQNPGDIADMPMFATSGQNEILAASDASYEDASFARVKNVSLSWLLPEKYLKKVHFKNLRLSLNMQNLFTITKYSGLDPETGNSGIQPFRTVVAGLQIGL